MATPPAPAPAPSPSAAAPAPAPPPAPTPGPIAAPTLLSPITGAAVFTTRPRVVVAIGEGSDGAEIELCADRACTQSVGKIAAPAKDGRATAVAPQPLAGRVFFRARGTRGAEVGSAYSPTWQLAIAKGATTLEASALSFSEPTLDELKAKHPSLKNLAEVGDVDGDGLSDAAGYTCPDAECKAPELALATAHGLTTLQWPSTKKEGGPTWTAVGDVNGDGFADAVASAGGYFVFYGSAKGLGDPKPVGSGGGILGWRDRQGFDLNGDGYMDYVGAKRPGGVGVHFGSATGLPTEPDVVLLSEGASPGSEGFGDDFGLGDVNGDGFADVIVGAYIGGPKHRGRVYVFYGGKTLSATHSVVIDEPPQQAKSKARPYFGIYLTVRDGDGDGLADIYASTSCYMDDQEKGYCKGSVTYLYKGARDGLKLNAPIENATIPKAE